MKEPDHRFNWHLCKTFGYEIDGSEIEEMDPIKKAYYFHHWMEDQNEAIELSKYHGYLIGSFTNPEAVRKMMEGNTVETTDEEFEKTSQMVRDASLAEKAKETKSKKRRKRKKITPA